MKVVLENYFIKKYKVKIEKVGKIMLKSWSKLEKILLFGSIILVSAVGIIFKSDILTTICSIVRNNDSIITC